MAVMLEYIEFTEYCVDMLKLLNSTIWATPKILVLFISKLNHTIHTNFIYPMYTVHMLDRNVDDVSLSRPLEPPLK